jgi:hypothetical protein
MFSTGQRISYVDLKDTTSAAADGSNLHLGMFFLDNPSSLACRLMGVYRGAAYQSHYLLAADRDRCFMWGHYEGSACEISYSPAALGYTAGLALVTGTSAGATQYNCQRGTTSCSSASFASVDRTKPSDWPVGVFAALGSDTGVKTETMKVGQALCGNTGRVAGYTIGYALTSTEVAALSAAWQTLVTDLGRV